MGGRVREGKREREREREFSVVSSSFYKDTGRIELGPHLTLVISLEALSPNGHSGG